MLMLKVKLTHFFCQHQHQHQQGAQFHAPPLNRLKTIRLPKINAQMLQPRRATLLPKRLLYHRFRKLHRSHPHPVRLKGTIPPAHPQSELRNLTPPPLKIKPQPAAISAIANGWMFPLNLINPAPALIYSQNSKAARQPCQPIVRRLICGGTGFGPV